MTTGAALLDTDTLSEIIKGRNLATQRKAQEYLGLHQRFQFSIITWRPGGRHRPSERHSYTAVLTDLPAAAEAPWEQYLVEFPAERSKE